MNTLHIAAVDDIDMLCSREKTVSPLIFPSEPELTGFIEAKDNEDNHLFCRW